jgi:Ca-activated chloride channel family protein
MTFLSPERLPLLLVPVLLAAAYLVVQRRRRRYAVRFTELALLDTVAPRRPAWRRHVAALGYLAAVTLLVVGVARPTAAMEVPTEPTVVLALDTSLSMEATDVAPDRLEAAQVAAGRFLDAVPAGVRVGLVAFDGNARALVPPTLDREMVRTTIERLRLGPGTAIGDAISVAVDLLPDAATQGDAQAGEGATAAGNDDVEAVVAGSVVLMSDGEATAGRDPIDAAKDARDRGVRVSTVAFGTDSGAIVLDGERIPVPVDRATLRKVADLTGGRPLEARTADDLAVAFEDLGAGVGIRTEAREVTDLVVLVALGVAVVAALASLRWASRLP